MITNVKKLENEVKEKLNLVYSEIKQQKGTNIQFYKRLFIYIDSRNYLLVEKLIKNLLFENTAHDLDRILLIYTYILQGKIETAKELLDDVNILNNKENKHLFFGDIYFVMSNYKKAEKEYKKYAISDNSEEAYLKLAQLYYQLGDIDNAINMFKRTSRLENKEIIIKMLERHSRFENAFYSKISVLYIYENQGLADEIQIISYNGESTIFCTGNVSSLVEEVCLVAFNYLRFNNKKYHLNYINNCNIHVHFPKFLYYKDGPSLGVSLLIGIYSNLKNKKLNHRWTFTGEVDIEGNVYPVGGIKQKLHAASVKGMSLAFVPYDNYLEINYLNYMNLQVIPIKNVGEVIDFFEANT